MSHFSNNLKADGHGEVWVDMRPETKFKQYGWRCTTKEDSYSNRTLIGNWNQERYDLCKLEERKPLPSQNQSGPYIHEKPGMPQTFLDADDLRASYAGFLHLDVVPSSTMQKTSTSHYTYAHYYETSYTTEYLRNSGSAGGQAFKKEPHVFPGHQPELNPPQCRSLQKSCYTIDYGSS